jgi:hypothetical protein
MRLSPSNIFFIVLILLVYLPCLSQEIQAPRVSIVSVGPCHHDKSPVIDGNLSDEIWRKCSFVPFIVDDRSPPTKFSVCYDEKYLYLAVKCLVRKGKIAAPMSNEELDIWRCENIEIFLALPGEAKSYYQFAITAANLRYNSRWRNAESIGWNGTWQSAVVVSDDTWQLEVAVLFSELVVSYPIPGETWRFNICRTRAPEGQPIRQYSWSPLIKANFHQPQYFGKLIFHKSQKRVAFEWNGDLFAGTKNIQFETRNLTKGKLHLMALRGDNFETIANAHTLRELSKSLSYVQSLADKALCIIITDGNDIIYASGSCELETPDSLKDIQNALIDDSRGIVADHYKMLKSKIENSRFSRSQRQAMWQSGVKDMYQLLNARISQKFFHNGPKDEKGQAVYGVGLACPMVKVWPTKLYRFRGRFADRIELRSAKNEAEAYQIVLRSSERELRDVRLEWTDLRVSHGDALISKEHIKVAPVGFVKSQRGTTKEIWAPDPILDCLDRFDVPSHRLQPIWYQVKVPEDAIAGLYHGTVTVAPTGLPSKQISVTLEVWDFALPKMPSLRTDVGIVHYEKALIAQGIQGKEYEYLLNKIDDLLIDYRIGPGTWLMPDAVSERRLKRWRDSQAVNLWSAGNIERWDMIGSSSGNLQDIEPKARAIIERDISTALDFAEKLGLREKAYIFILDERKKPDWPVVEKVAAWAREKFPDVELLSTSYEHSYGAAKDGIPSLTSYCPSIKAYNRDRAAFARQRGKKVWWYTYGIGIDKPYPGVRHEAPAMDLRLITGFMSYIYQVDGFLYWSLTSEIDQKRFSNNPIAQGPYLQDWNIVNLNTGYDQDGCGNMLYPKSDWSLMTGQRLENWRDGLEDYEYLTLLQQRIDDLQKKGKTVLANQLTQRFKPYTKPGNIIVNSMTDYADDPEVLSAIRQSLAECILMSYQ